MSIRGDELDALLGGFASGLEKALALVESSGSSNGAGFSTFLNDSSAGKLPTESTGEMIDRLAGTQSADRNLAPLNAVAESLRIKADVSALSPLAGMNDNQHLDLLGSLVGGDSGAGRAASAAGGRLAVSGISALLDTFRGPAEGTQWEAYERQRYQWETPSTIVEGLDGNRAQTRSVDSRYDGTPRPIDRADSTGTLVNVRIEALDARSFLDRKEDIAEAVRQAMLTSGVLGSALGEY